MGLMLSPPLRRRLLGDFGPAFWCQLLAPSCPTSAPERLSRCIFTRIARVLLKLASRNPHDLDGVADHVGRALLASGPLGIVDSNTDKLADRVQHPPANRTGFVGFV